MTVALILQVCRSCCESFPKSFPTPSALLDIYSSTESHQKYKHPRPNRYGFKLKIKANQNHFASYACLPPCNGTEGEGKLFNL